MNTTLASPLAKPKGKSRIFAIVGVYVFFAFCQFAIADVKLPSIFADHMVLQQGATVPIWGWASPGESVTVDFAGQAQTATADGGGRWKTALDKLAPGDPQTLRIAGKNTIVIRDVLVGEIGRAHV